MPWCFACQRGWVVVERCKFVRCAQPLPLVEKAIQRVRSMRNGAERLPWRIRTNQNASSFEFFQAFRYRYRMGLCGAHFGDSLSAVRDGNGFSCLDLSQHFGKARSGFASGIDDGHDCIEFGEQVWRYDRSGSYDARSKSSGKDTRGANGKMRYPPWCKFFCPQRARRKRIKIPRYAFFA